MWNSKLVGCLVICLIFRIVKANIPANCLYEDIRGTWQFQETEINHTRDEDCTKNFPYPRTTLIELDYPNVATDYDGNKGTWTMIYNQGFEVIIKYRRYFAFSKFTQNGNKVVSYCNETSVGWSHTLDESNWACYKGHKINGFNKDSIKISNGKMHHEKPFLFESISMREAMSEENVQKINSKQSSWTAKVYPQFKNKSTEELIRMAGGRASRLISRPKVAPSSPEIDKLIEKAPKSFDWRNVNNVNYVSPVGNQAHCASGYIFSSMGQLEARVRILTNNSDTTVLSTQQVCDCSQYSQACSGGFPYLAGKYAQDYGIVPDNDYPYNGNDQNCQLSNITDKRIYTADYQYVGGYYGASNENLMILDLLQNGPLSVCFEVYDDFLFYAGGIYSHNSTLSVLKSSDKFNPFQLTNQAVLVVGYGADQKTGEKYWIVKNSWGIVWGLSGYFWIKRGNDECGIESMALSAIPNPVPQ